MKEQLFNLRTLLGLGVFVLVTAGSAKSAALRDVVINEIAWMGTAASTDDEWIELYNNTDSAIDLSGWTLVSEDGTPTIDLSGTVPAHGYFLLERTDDNTVSDVVADLTYSGALGNSGEKFQLKDDSGQIIDEVDCSGGWFAGTNTPKATMERRHTQIDGSTADSWETNDGVTMNGNDVDGNPINGTPKAQNSVFDISLSVKENPIEPSTCELFDNYPNPFNPSTTVWYEVPGRGGFQHVTLRIYTLMGQQVATLVDGLHQPGGYSVHWDGCDHKGKEVSSGVYLYQLVLGGRIIETRRMVKMK